MDIIEENLTFKEQDDGIHWTLIGSAVCEIPLPDPTAKEPTVSTTVTIPDGFITDFASVPKAFWSVYGPIGKYNNAALVHDYLYDCQRYPKDWCDTALLVLMKKVGIGAWTRYPIYYAVKFFGKSAFDSCKKK